MITVNRIHGYSELLILIDFENKWAISVCKIMQYLRLAVLYNVFQPRSAPASDTQYQDYIIYFNHELMFEQRFEQHMMFLIEQMWWKWCGRVSCNFTLLTYRHIIVNSQRTIRNYGRLYWNNQTFRANQLQSFALWSQPLSTQHRHT